ncbi:MAG: hypothetical protein RL732_395 [Bacteroidota bacterium]|jgi:hypothetical protein
MEQAVGFIIGVVLLMMVNWGIEALKWQLAIRLVQSVSWSRSYKAILAGTTLAFFTPNRMGEYLGRIFYLDEQHRIKAISLTIVGSMAQIIITFLFGTAGLLVVHGRLMQVYAVNPMMELGFNAFFYGMGAVLLVFLVFYFRFSWLARWLGRLPLANKFKASWEILAAFPAGALLQLLLLSLIRYLVFIIQYYLLFRLFDVQLDPWQAFWSMSVVFLVMAIIPTIALFTDLGVRWKTSISVLQLFSPNIVGILATSLLIWIINLVIPALLGSLLILKIRIFKNNVRDKDPAAAVVNDGQESL